MPPLMPLLLKPPLRAAAAAAAAAALAAGAAEVEEEEGAVAVDEEKAEAMREAAPAPPPPPEDEPNPAPAAPPTALSPAAGCRTLTATIWPALVPSSTHLRAVIEVRRRTGQG